MDKIAERMEKDGYKVRKEYPIGGGKTIDVLAVKDGKKTAVEVETGKSDVMSNIRKAVEEGMDYVIVAVTKKAVMKKIEEQVANGNFPADSGVRVVLANELLR